MRALLTTTFIGLLLCLAIFGGHYIFEDSGYVLVTLGKYSLEMTLWSLVFGLLGLWVVLRLLFYVVARVLRLGSATRFYLFHKSELKAQLTLRQGLNAFLLGDWMRAEKLLASAGKHSGLVEAKHMFAAVAADANGDDAKVMLHLNALDEDDDDTILLKAKLFINRHDWHQAHELIEPLYRKKPKDDGILKLYVDILTGLEDYSALLTMLPLIEKRQCFSESTMAEFAATVVKQALLHTAQEQSFEAAEQVFNQLPSKLKKQPYAISAYVMLLAASGKSDQAQAELLRALKKSSVTPYLPVFRQVRFDHSIELNQFVQNALKQDEHNPDLLCALGYLAVGKGDWALAAKALVNATDTTDRCTLAKAYCEIGETHKAVAIYQALQSLSAKSFYCL